MKFLRRNSTMISKLGKRRKSKQVWRKPKGRDNKMREMKRGYPAIVKVGYSSARDLRGTYEGKETVLVYTTKELGRVDVKTQVAIFGKIGKKNKIELAKIAIEKKITVINLNVKKFLDKVSKEKKK